MLAGDHKQLPPTIISNKSRKLQETLFEKLIISYDYKSSLLNCQYRMNEKLMSFPNSEFYDNKLFSDDSVKSISLNDLDKKTLGSNNISKNFNKKLSVRLNNINKFFEDENYPFLFLDTSLIERNMEIHLNDSKSVLNKVEANIINIIVSNYLI